MEGGLVGRSSTKWLSVWASELVYTWPCEHTLNMSCDKTPRTNKTTYAMCDWLKGTSDKCDTWDRSLKDHDDNCTTLHTTLCASMTDAYIMNTTCTHKDRSWT